MGALLVAPSISVFKSDGVIAKGAAVKPGSDNNHVAAGAANTNPCFGVMQSAATTAAEQLCEIAVGGGAKFLLGEQITAGDSLVSHTDGTFVKPNALGDRIVGIADESGVVGDLISGRIALSKAPAAE